MEQGALNQIELFADVQAKKERLIGLNVGLTMFFEIPFRAHAQQIGRAFSAYLRQVPWETFTFQNLTGTSRGYKKIAPSARATISDWTTGARDYGRACSIWLKDGQSATEASDHLWNLFGKDDADTEADSNYLQILFPADVVDRLGGDVFAEYAHDVIKGTPYHSAYIGYTLGTSTLLPVSPYSDLMDARLYAVGKRFPGAEITRPHLENYEMAAHVRSASWITYVSNALLDRIGGAKKVRASLKGNFTYRETSIGLGIQAGDRPQLGDRNRRLDVLAEQKALARVLEPLYSKQPAYLFSRKPHEETLAWFRRLVNE